MNEEDKKNDELLSRGVEMIYPTKEALRQVLLSGKKLKIYTGIDPTGKLHIGHAVILRKLRQFQELGHEIIVLIGDFTAQIGDPTGKLATRKTLSKKQIEENAIGYKELVGKILDTTKSNVRFLHNEEWTNKLKPVDLLELASCFTVSQLLERDMFQNRIKEGKEIHVNEFLYPLFQAYDSVTMDVDMEIGGNDQTFNMMAGRTLMKKTKNKEKFVLTMKLLTDSSGKKMGKTEGNMVNLDESSENMYGMIMSWADNLIIIGLEICTDVPMDKIKKYEDDIKENKINPRDVKMELAHEVVKSFHGEEKAESAENYFVSAFTKKEIPDDIQEITAEDGSELGDVLVKNKIVASKSEFTRLVKAGAVDVENTNTTDIKFKINKTSVVKVGKKKFVKIIVS